MDAENIPSVFLPLFSPDFASRAVTRLTKVPVATVRRLNFLLTLYLEDISLITRTQKELIITSDTLIFLLESQGFLINTEKLVV